MVGQIAIVTTVDKSQAKVKPTLPRRSVTETIAKAAMIGRITGRAEIKI
jgi:hypothetical protein